MTDINFVDGQGISIQTSDNVDGGQDVEIANLIFGIDPAEDGQVLTVDSGSELGLVFADPAGSPADDLAVWMPLSTVVAGVPELVWGGDDSLIPTLTPLD